MLSARVIDFVFLEFFIEIATGCLIIVELVFIKSLFEIIGHKKWILGNPNWFLGWFRFNRLV